MSLETTYICDVCGKPIKGRHQKLFMATVTISWYEYHFDDGSENCSKTYYVHNDLSNHCLTKLWRILEKGKK